MMPPLADVGPRPLTAQPAARRRNNTAPYVLPQGEPVRPIIGRYPRHLAIAFLGALALTCLRRARLRRRPTPVMHCLVAAEDQRFAELCQQITYARGRAAQ
jgi:hypothetical protein